MSGHLDYFALPILYQQVELRKTLKVLQKSTLKMERETGYLDAKYKEMRSDLSLFTVF